VLVENWLPVVAADVGGVYCVITVVTIASDKQGIIIIVPQVVVGECVVIGRRIDVDSAPMFELMVLLII